MRYQRADLVWAPLLVVSAGLPLTALGTNDVDWRPLLMVALAYPAGRRMPSLALALWVFTAAASAGLALAFRHPPDPFSDWLSLLFTEFAAAVLPWWVGRYRRLLAEQHERERGAAADQARLRERARIAQDMHDALGHELALIALHGGALELATALTDEQRRAAAQMRVCAVRATGRLHDIVAVLGSAGAAADLQPSDESITDLVRRTATAGMRVRLRHDGPAPAWSPMASQAAHRVVQESLTNAARHAPGARVTVTVAGDRIAVVNEPTARPGTGGGSGQGLIGLDERVRLVGGSLSAGPLPGGGWEVAAVLADGTAPARPEVDLGVSRRLMRRRLRQTALLPLAVGLVLVAAPVAVEVVDVRQTALAADRYDQLRPGQPRADVEHLLPPRDIGRTPRIVAHPPEPAGASCAYYGQELFELGPYVYQLCFTDGVLVAKNRLEQA